MSIQMIVNSLLIESMEILPFRLLAVYIFRRQFRVSTWAVVLGTCALQIVQAIVYSRIIIIGLPTQWAEYGFELLFLVLLAALIRTSRWRMLFQYIFILDYSITIHGIARVADAVFFHGPRQPADHLLIAVSTALIIAVSAPFVIRFLKKSSSLTAEISAPFFWRTIWMLPAINTLIILMYTNRITREHLLRPQYLISRTLLLLSMILIYVILMRILNVIRRETLLEEQAAEQEHFLAAERIHYEQLERYLMETRRVRHDTKQHLRIINNFIESEDYLSLKQYMRQYEESLPQNAPQTWCASHAANVLISYYAGECQSHGIHFSAEVSLPEQLPAAEPDVCSILGNLLENALAACLEAPDLSPFIKLRARTGTNQIILTVDNTCAQPPQMEGDSFRSTRHDGMGVGTVSIRATAQKYHGSAKFRYEDHVFYSSVLLFPQKS